MYLSRYSSEHNQKAKCYLFQHLSNKFSNTYSPRKIKRKSQFFLSYLFLCICALQSFVHFQHACTVKSPIFRQEACVVLCYIATQVQSRCPIFRQYPVKMSLLLAGSMLCVISCGQDAASFGSTLSRCPIFRQYPVKMSHLSAGSMLCVVSCTQILSK